MSWATARVPPVAIACLLVMTVACSAHRPTQVGGASACSSWPPSPHPGAPAALSLNSQGAEQPAWSSTIGVVEAASAGQAFSVLGACLVAFSPASGAVSWTATDPGHRFVAGLAANTATVVAATGIVVGGPHTAAVPEVNRLIGLNPASGKRRWDLTLARDGQTLPAVIEGPVVVVAEADGTVEAVGTLDGRERWIDPPPAGCSPPPDTNDALSPAAVILAGAPGAVVVAYSCRPGSIVADINPGTGTIAWTWRTPLGSTVDTQAPAAAEGGVVGIVVTPEPHSSAAASVAAWDLGAGLGGSESMVAIRLDTGLPVWELDGVPSSPAVLVGPNRICVAAIPGVECRDAASGAASWQWTSLPQPPPSGSLLFESDSPGVGVVAADGRLYWAAPTALAPLSADPVQVRPTAAPGLFTLGITDLADGALISNKPLPGYNQGPDGVGVSVSSPPGVLAVGAGAVFVSPQLRETEVVEAFRLIN